MTAVFGAPPTMRPDRRLPRSKATWAGRLRVVLATIASTVLLFAGSLLMLLVALATGFQARRFYAETMARGLSRAALKLYGVRIVEHRDLQFPATQTVFISNHTSALDMFVIIALGLPNCRYFLSGFLRKILPLWLIGWLIGVFWTALQTNGAKRTRIFQNADRLLRKTGESVFLTPEGQITGVFNRGAFHLATSLGAPIQPMYILIPNEVDPGPWTNGDGLDVRSGEVHVFYKPALDTSRWTIAEVAQRRDEVRLFYEEWRKELTGE
jgi:hypothetical protein